MAIVAISDDSAAIQWRFSGVATLRLNMFRWCPNTVPKASTKDGSHDSGVIHASLDSSEAAYTAWSGFG